MSAADEVPESLGMLFDGCAATQCVDTSGEVVDIAGVDCAAFDGPDGIPLNLEHESNKVPLGHVVYYKKILKAGDCDNDRQRDYWAKCKQTPYIYVICRLYDTAGHPDAVKAAATIRDRHAHGEPLSCRLSIEGSTLSKEDNLIKACIFRALAATFHPANKTATTGLLLDPGAPEGFSKLDKAEFKDPAFRRIGGAVIIDCDPLLKAEDLKKTLTAGSTAAAPGTLSGGAALQREDSGLRGRIATALKKYGFRRPFTKTDFKAFVKADLPDVSDAFLDHFADVAEHLTVRLGKSEEPEIEHAPGDLEIASAALSRTADMERRLVDLRRSMQDPFGEPEIHRIKFRASDGVMRNAGRILVDDGIVHHLEDYHGIVPGVIPEGPLSPYHAGVLDAFRNSGGIQSAPHTMVDTAEEMNPANGSPPEPAEPAVEASVEPDPILPPAVFHYCRVGHSAPHVVEFGPNGPALDGSLLAPDEAALILRNVVDGLATLRYASSLSGVQPISPDVQGLAKADSDSHDIGGVLQRFRKLVEAGHATPEDERVFTAHVMGDSMSGWKLGNKYAYQKFREENRPGVYVSGDLNDFKHLNDTHGHDAGDQAITAAADAFHSAGQAVGTGKIFRPGGDEFVGFFPTFEEAAAFTRHATKHLDSIPPVGGTHRISASFGLGHDFGSADRALFDAKAQKVDQKTGARAFPPGRTPHLAHSRIAGSEGPVILHDPSPPQLPPAPKPLIPQPPIPA